MFVVRNSNLQYIKQFKYLRHFISSNLTEDEDVQREISNMFIRTIILFRKFHNCSMLVYARKNFAF